MSAERRGRVGQVSDGYGLAVFLVDMLCGVIEDGGEMVMASLIACVALRQVRNTALLNV